MALPYPKHAPIAIGCSPFDTTSERQVAVLRPIVGVAADLLLVGIPEVGHRSSVGAQAIGGDRRG